ncbi:MAG: alkaline phosphatase family protein [Gemmatimonadota bacterium]|nr:alkaline phosphatase family protein [Gemmatimonadota bacterium]
MGPYKRVIVIGLDGLEPTIVDAMLADGRLPNLARLRSEGGYSRVATTSPAQTPVAWSTFATGVNPGGHGIFDFLRRDPKTYLPDLSLNRYEQKNTFLPPKAVNLRGGTPLWQVLGEAGIPATVIRCPCTYPPDPIKGRMLSGMGVPDLRGGIGTATLYTTTPGAVPRESEQVIPITASGGSFTTHLIGPRNPKAGTDLHASISVILGPDGGATLQSDGHPKSLDLRPGLWSDWLRIRFKTGLLQSTSGLVQFLLVRTTPHIELYASPINFDPEAPLFPISAPWEYSTELARAIGGYATMGMIEDHRGLSNERFGEVEYLAHCDLVMGEREAMLEFELGRFSEGLLYCLFDTPDRIQHMFWRFREPDHPANAEARRVGGTAGDDAACGQVIEAHYQRCDRAVGMALKGADESTLVVVLSDHGFTSFQRGVHLNSWLHQEGLLTLKAGAVPGEGAGEFFREVDWSRTRAYALGIGGIYLNQAGREAQGIVPADEAGALAGTIAAALTGLPDPDRGTVTIRGVATRSELYSGPYADQSPDLQVHCAAGYRASWTTALGGIPTGLFEDNIKRWSGDHIVDPALVPGVLFMNRAFAGDSARLQDLAPTILTALGVAVPTVMEGSSLL